MDINNAQNLATSSLRSQGAAFIQESRLGRVTMCKVVGGTGAPGAPGVAGTMDNSVNNTSLNWNNPTELNDDQNSNQNNFNVSPSAPAYNYPHCPTPTPTERNQYVGNENFYLNGPQRNDFTINPTFVPPRDTMNREYLTYDYIVYIQNQLIKSQSTCISLLNNFLDLTSQMESKRRAQQVYTPLNITEMKVNRQYYPTPRCTSRKGKLNTYL